MTDTPEKTSRPEKSDKSAWTSPAALAGAAIGSAALAAALLYASSRRKPKKPTTHPEDAPETD